MRKGTGAHYTKKVGAWLSLVERLVRDQEAGGSNPLAPTNPLLVDFRVLPNRDLPIDSTSEVIHALLLVQVGCIVSLEINVRFWTAVLALYCFTPTWGQSPSLRSNDGKNENLGNLNSNRYDPDSISNPYGQYGSRYSPNSVNNPYGQYGSRYSPNSANNPYATQAPIIVTPSGKYLGKFSANPYDPDSVSNPFGKYGSPYSPDSINDPYGRFGSPYSPDSATNPYGWKLRPQASSGVGDFTIPTLKYALPPIRSLPANSGGGINPLIPLMVQTPKMPSLLGSIFGVEILRKSLRQRGLNETLGLQQPEAPGARRTTLRATDERSPSQEALQVAHDRYQRGEALLERSLFEEAVTEYQTALDLTPGNRFVAMRLELARKLAQAGTRESRTNEPASLPEALQAAHDHYQRGEALLEHSLFEQAATEYQTALELTPGNRFVAMRLELARRLAGAEARTKATAK